MNISIKKKIMNIGIILCLYIFNNDEIFYLFRIKVYRVIIK